jgi:photosystem II stability/assembly factor-like uncharacterized protein
MNFVLGVGTGNGLFILGPHPDGDWRVLSQALVSKAVSAISVDDSGAVYAGVYNGPIYRSRDLENWAPLYEGIHYPSIASLAIDRRNPGRIWAGTQPAGLFVSHDSGASFAQVKTLNQVPSASQWSSSVPPYQPRVQKVMVHSNNSDIVLVAVNRGGLYATSDGGQTWHERGQGLNKDVLDFACHKESPSRIYAVTSIGFYRSDDFGGSWTQMVKGLPYTSATRVVCIPEDANVLMLGVHRSPSGGGSLFRSRNGGESWEVCPAQMPFEPLHKITALASGNGAVVVGTDGGGLFVTYDFGKVWSRVRPRLAAVHSLCIIHRGG